MITKITSKSIGLHNYPKIVTWTYKGELNSVEVNGWELWNTLLLKLVSAQIDKTPFSINKIKYRGK